MTAATPWTNTPSPRLKSCSAWSGHQGRPLGDPRSRVLAPELCARLPQEDELTGIGSLQGPGGEHAEECRLQSQVVVRLIPFLRDCQSEAVIPTAHLSGLGLEEQHLAGGMHRFPQRCLRHARPDEQPRVVVLEIGEALARVVAEILVQPAVHSSMTLIAMTKCSTPSATIGMTDIKRCPVRMIAERSAVRPAQFARSDLIAGTHECCGGNGSEQDGRGEELGNCGPRVPAGLGRTTIDHRHRVDEGEPDRAREQAHRTTQADGSNPAPLHEGEHQTQDGEDAAEDDLVAQPTRSEVQNCSVGVQGLTQMERGRDEAQQQGATGPQPRVTPSILASLIGLGASRPDTPRDAMVVTTSSESASMVPK